MSMLDDVGEIVVSGNTVHWTVNNFFNLPQRGGTWIRSPRFRFQDDDRCVLYIFPNGDDSLSSVGWFGMILHIYRETSFRCTLGLIGENPEIAISRAQYSSCGTYRVPRLISRADFEARKDQLAPNGNLHAFCEIPTSADEPAQSKAELGTKEPEKAKRDQTACAEASTQTDAELDIGKLVHYFKDVLLSGKSSDVTLTENNKELRAHRSSPMAESRVSLAVMEHEMKEHAAGTMDIEGSDIFPGFLHYLCTGSVEKLTSENALNLYAAAKKQVAELKNVCARHVVNNISVENFCDVLTFLLQHNDTELTDLATEFFVENSIEIVLTAQWQEFLRENPEASNALLIKLLRAKQ